MHSPAYNPTIHTAEALQDEINTIYGVEPNTLLVGSLGRAVLYGVYLNDAEYEYRANQESPILRSKKEVRDIDAIGFTPAVAVEVGPYVVDTEAFDNRSVRISREGDDWVLESDCYRFAEQIPAAAMEPIEAYTVYDTPCQTVSVQTHLALLGGMYGLLRTKDIKNLQLLRQLADHEDVPHMPNELFAPFQRLAELNSTGWFPKAQFLYRTVVPQPVRHKLRPLAFAIKKACVS